MKKILNSVILAALLAACTDYVAEIDDRYGEWETASVTPSSSSSSKVGEPVEPAEVTSGTMTDSRDGQTYKTVTIGTQTWMAQNLNYKAVNSSCYDVIASYCSKYGRLYTWAAATTACPEGWHLPTKAEFETLFTAVGGQSTAGKVLKSTSGWNRSGNGSDAFAFSALPAGGMNNGGRYYSEGDEAIFWSSSEDDSNFAYFMYLDFNNVAAYLNNYKNYGFSVRCLKDEGTTPQSSSSTKISSSSDTPESSSSEAKSSSSSVTQQSSSSEKAESSSSKVTEPVEVTTGTMTDSRDGQTYKTVTIGTQTWMAQNLNYETANSYCYDDKTSYCSKYGRLYTWVAATTACPEGWYLPTKAEFETLFTAVGGQSTAGKVLKYSDNGSDAFAFSALPAGFRFSNGNYNYEGNFANFWSSSEYNSNNAYSMRLYYHIDDANLNYYNKYDGFSVRCLKD